MMAFLGNSSAHAVLANKVFYLYPLISHNQRDYANRNLEG